MPLPRFYFPLLDPAVPGGALPEDEANHLTRVMRLGKGDDIAVFDGRGREFRARVAAAGRGGVQVTLVEPLTPAPEARVRLTLVQAVLKGEKMAATIRDATMMGVAAIEPVVTSRTIARTGRDTGRWEKIAIASAKQCRRAVVPTIAPPCPFSTWLTASAHGLRLILVEPSTGVDTASLRVLEDHAPGSLALLVGPEGGWTDDEQRQAAAAGCIAVTLGPLTLRADAVATAALAIARFALRDY